MGDEGKLAIVIAYIRRTKPITPPLVAPIPEQWYAWVAATIAARLRNSLVKPLCRFMWTRKKPNESLPLSLSAGLEHDCRQKVISHFFDCGL